MPKRTYGRRSSRPGKKRKVSLSASAAATRIQRAWRAKRAAKRKYNNGRLITSVGTIRPTAVANLVYETYDELSVSTAIGKGYEVFDVAGLYDPEVETGGGQSRLFDQMMTLYNRYRVLSAYVTVEIFNSGWANVAEPLIVGLYQSDDNGAADFAPGTASGGLAHTRNLLTSKSHNAVMKSGMTVGTDQLGGKRIYLRQKITNPYLSNSGHENRDKEGTASANPAVGGYTNLVVHADGQTGNTTLKYRIRMNCRTLFSDPKSVVDA